VQPTDPRGRFRDLTVDAFIDRLGSSEPVPGGGSASAVAAALGASLVTMVASLSTGRPKFADHEPLLSWAIDTGRRLAETFLAIADADSEAYAAFSAARKLPRGSDAEIAVRADAMRTAARHASEIPLQCVEACLELVGVAEALAGRSNANASSDLNVAALLGEAAARGAAANVLVNLPSIGDPDLEASLMARVEELLTAIATLAADARLVVGGGETRDPIDPAGAA
jgi:formiminotetrahydrofolate cyclodeaminase